MKPGVPGPATAAPPRRGGLFLPALLLVVLALAVYLPTLGHGLIVYDDAVYVSDVARDEVRALTWENVRWALTSFHQGFYAPATWISYMVDASLSGTAARGFHLTNLLLHAANGVALLLVLAALTGARWRSALAAALLVAHPMHVESVAWVTARKDVLSMLFLLLALRAYLGWRRRPGPARYLAATALYALGLAAKPTVVVFPLLLLALEFWPLGPGFHAEPGGTRGWRLALRAQAGALVRVLPFLALAGVFSALTYVAHRQIFLPPTTPGLLLRRAGDALVHVTFYLRKLVWPRELSLFYAAPDDGHSALSVVAAGSLLLLLTLHFLRAARAKPFLLAGWCWFLAALIPVLQLVKTAEHPVADRFAYVPFIGAYVALSWAAAGWPRALRAAPALRAGIAVAVVAALAVRARAEVGLWGDQVRLFGAAVRAAPENMRARILLGDALAERGMLPEAMAVYRLVATRLPGRDEPYRQLGTVLHRQGAMEDALAHFREAARLAPTVADNQFNLGVVLLDLGRVEEAVRRLEEAVRLRPDDVRAITNLAVALGELGDTEGARERFRQALAGNPGHPLALENFAVLLAREGRYAEAAAMLRAAVRADPGSADVRVRLGRLLDLQGRAAEARAQYREALRLDPAHPGARAALDASPSPGRRGEE